MLKLVYFIGPHSSGKTTIIKRISELCDVSFVGSEIGKDLFYSLDLETETQDSDFEDLVTGKELDRDIYIKNNVDGLALVETWHVGNLSYAYMRNPDYVGSLVSKIKKSPFIGDALGIYLDIPKEEIRKRTRTFRDKKDWACDFYTEIVKKYPLCYVDLGVQNIKKVDANKSLDLVVEDVIAILKENNFL